MKSRSYASDSRELRRMQDQLPLFTTIFRITNRKETQTTPLPHPRQRAMVGSLPPLPALCWLAVRALRTTIPGAGLASRYSSSRAARGSAQSGIVLSYALNVRAIYSSVPPLF